jgi:hypothetical protein
MMMLVVACGWRRFFPTLPPKAKRSGRPLEEPPEIVIGVELPAFFFGSDFALYIEEEPQLFPALALSAPRRRFCEAFACDAYGWAMVILPLLLDYPAEHLRDRRGLRVHQRGLLQLHPLLVELRALDPLA